MFLSFVQASLDAAIAALHNTSHFGRVLQVSVSRPPPLGTADTPHTVFIMRLPATWDPAVAEARLREHYQSCGEIVDVRLPRYPNGTLRGLGYVQFSSPAGASAALARGRAVTLAGAALKVMPSTASKQRFNPAADAGPASSDTATAGHPQDETAVAAAAAFVSAAVAASTVAPTTPAMYAAQSSFSSKMVFACNHLLSPFPEPCFSCGCLACAELGL